MLIDQNVNKSIRLKKKLFNAGAKVYFENLLI